MAVQRTIVPEWRDQQADSRYPFSDSSKLISGVTEIPKDTFLDAALHPVGGTAPLYLKKIDIQANLVLLTISDSKNLIEVTGSFDPFGNADSIALVDRYGRNAGLLVCDEERIKRFQSWALGSYDFGLTAEFVASVTVPLPEYHVTGFILPDGSVVTGEVWFVGEKGIAVRKDEGAIRFDIIGDPLFKRFLCKDETSRNDLFVTPRFLKTINGIPADQYGNFVITVNNKVAGDTILRVYPDAENNVLRIELVGQRLESVL